MNLGEFNKEDYWNIKWNILFMLLGTAVVVGLFLGLRILDKDALASLRTARSGYETAQQSLGKIEEEETTILEYIDRYAELQKARIVGDEDRLELFESVARLRTEYELFPITISVGGQDTTLLPYAPEVRDPGRPVLLRHSSIDFTMPLLHEDDLARLLSALLQRPDLVQSWHCSLLGSSRKPEGYIRLGQHFTSSCELAWLSFSVAGNVGAAP